MVLVEFILIVGRESVCHDHYVLWQDIAVLSL